MDKDLYGPDNHLVEWHRTLTTQETDGFQVKRPGDKNVRCTILLLLDYQPLQVTFLLNKRDVLKFVKLQMLNILIVSDYFNLS